MKNTSRKGFRHLGQYDRDRMDIVEVSPPFDSSDITAMLANRVVLEALSAIALKKRGGTYSPMRNLLDR